MGIDTSTYRYSICYKKVQSLSNADALSRLLLPVTAAEPPVPADWEFLVNHLSSTCITDSHIKDWTSKDKGLSQVKHFILTCWLKRVLNIYLLIVQRGMSFWLWMDVYCGEHV